ncbi:MAG TPA: DUF3052 family protein [Gemmatimonadales bacterium]|nr:DUF3052 family protein [Gemmatimonadales bacterium]
MKASAGYSGTPLAKKLGIDGDSKVVATGAPRAYLPGIRLQKRVTAATDVVHVFHDRASALQAELVRLRKTIRDDATVWVSWPKKSAKVATDITENTIRDLALPLGFVDVKVCAIDETWSGLKLVIRKELRR